MEYKLMPIEKVELGRDYLFSYLDQLAVPVGYLFIVEVKVISTWFDDGELCRDYNMDFWLYNTNGESSLITNTDREQKHYGIEWGLRNLI